MSTLVLALALCSVPGNAPEGISAETEQPLRLSGTWAGRLTTEEEAFPCRVCPDDEGPALWLFEAPSTWAQVGTFLDEGRGRLRLQTGATEACLGIYRWEGGRVLICLGQPRKGRPTSFRVTSGQDMITLRRVKQP